VRFDPVLVLRALQWSSGADLIGDVRMVHFSDWKPTPHAAKKASDAGKRADLHMLALLFAAIIILWLYAKS
jgi:hypothetical protein